MFPEIYIAFRIFINLPVTVASGERKFSKLSLLINYHLRSTLGQTESSINALSTDHEFASKMCFLEVIHNFNCKNRRFSVPPDVL